MSRRGPYLDNRDCEVDESTFLTSCLHCSIVFGEMAGFKDLLPSHLYKPSWMTTPLAQERMKTGDGAPSTFVAAPKESVSPLFIPASLFKTPIKNHSSDYYTACAIGGILSCGLTHMGVTPLDVVKCNMQTNPVKYKSIPTGFKTVYVEQGMPGIFRGWVPTLIGYSMQGACKFGFYEYFKKQAFPKINKQQIMN